MHIKDLVRNREKLYLLCFPQALCPFKLHAGVPEIGQSWETPIICPMVEPKTKRAGFRSQWRRPTRVRIPSPAP
jgi:hypothetical protein